MNTKLTLTIEDSVISVAKKYAKNKGESLSHIVENYLRSLSTNDTANEEISPRILKLKGSIKLPEDFDYKKSLSNALNEKYNS